MEIPKLKRVTVSSERELNAWLAGQSAATGAHMLVTHCNPSSPKHVSRAQVRDALCAHGWCAGRRFTLTKSLVGHVIRPQPRPAAR